MFVTVSEILNGTDLDVLLLPIAVNASNGSAAGDFVDGVDVCL